MEHRFFINCMYFYYIGSNNRVCIVGNETEEDLNKPVFRNTGDIVSVSMFNYEVIIFLNNILQCNLRRLDVFELNYSIC